MRRASFIGISGGEGGGEPLIVVEESDGIAEEEEEEEETNASPPETASINQYLLAPWRDTRKRSLPTPACTSGITASQVRRLSERGGEGSGPSPVEQAFLATLSQAPAPVPGARRHSVVTISKAPPLPPLFGRSRRESVAAFASGLPGLPLRRDSVSNQPRGSLSGASNSGSSFNLHLDIMDDITEAKAKAKERRKPSRTQSKEAADESESGEGRSGRAAAPEGHSPPAKDPEPGPKKRSGPGIVCTDTDLISILSPLTSSAQEISGASEKEKEASSLTRNPSAGSPTQSMLDRKRKQFKDRSNSFDVGASPGTVSGPASWFVKRHQPMAKKDEVESRESSVVVTFADEKQKTQTSLVKGPERAKSAKGKGEASKTSPPAADGSGRVVWDNRSGSLVDPQLLGSAIEVFLNKKTGQEPGSPATKTPAQPEDSPAKSPPGISDSWFGGDAHEAVSEAGSDTCDTSICSTLKDLFVK